jgi:hypothetical protein
VLDNGLSVVGILLDVSDEPPDRLLVVLVLLALNDDLHNASANEYGAKGDGTDLLHAVDELVTTLLGEVLLGEEVVGTVTLLASLVLALIRHTVNKVVLKKRKGGQHRMSDNIRTQQRRKTTAKAHQGSTEGLEASELVRTWRYCRRLRFIPNNRCIPVHLSNDLAHALSDDPAH